MIKSFRHRGLRRWFEQADARGLKQDQVRRIARVLSLLESADTPEQAGQLPGMRLHRLSGDLTGLWSLSVSGNWRIVFRFEDGNAYDVDLVDYH